MKTKIIFIVISMYTLTIACKKKEFSNDIGVEITASKTNIFPGDTVKFNCHLLGYNGEGVKSFTWNFAGGNNFDNGDVPPVYVVYNNVGEYDVSLEIITGSDRHGYDTKVHFIKVN